MNELSFFKKIFLAAMFGFFSLVLAVAHKVGAGEAGQDGARIIAGIGMIPAMGVVLWAILGPVIRAAFGIDYEIADAKEAKLEERALQAAADAQEAEITRMSAPMALAEASESPALLQAVEGLQAAYSAWQAVLEAHPTLEQRRFSHAMRTVEVACQATLNDPILVKSETAHQRLVTTMNALSHELLDDLKEVEEDRLQDLSINLSVLERQVSLEIDAVAEVRA